MAQTPLMPKATAVWLVENTALTFDQIAEFCNLHPLEVKGIADGDVAQGIRGMDPIMSGELSRAELETAEANNSHKLILNKTSVDLPEVQSKKQKKYKSNFSMYIITNKKQYLVVHFNQILFQYIDKIVYSIDEFFDYLTKSDTITTYQYSLQYNKGDKYIHLVSEIYYLIVVIVLKIPFILKNLNFNSNLKTFDFDFNILNKKIIFYAKI